MSATSESLRRDARQIVDTVLREYGGPCSQAYADLLRAYISAPPGGRDALFLEVTYRSFGDLVQEAKTSPSSPQASGHSDRQPSPKISDLPAGHRELATFVLDSLALIQKLQAQIAEEHPDAPR